MSSPTNPYHPPESPVGGDATKGNKPLSQREMATRGNRLLAAVLDGLTTMFTVLPVMYYLGLFKRPEAFETQITAFLLGFVTVLILNGLLLHTRGQSIGKAIVGIQIVGLDGSRISLARIIFLRYFPVQLVSQFPTIGSLLTLMDIIWIFRSDQRCIHDHIAHTVVVNFEPFE